MKWRVVPGRRLPYGPRPSMSHCQASGLQQHNFHSAGKYQATTCHDMGYLRWSLATAAVGQVLVTEQA